MRQVDRAPLLDQFQDRGLAGTSVRLHVDLHQEAPLGVGHDDPVVAERDPVGADGEGKPHRAGALEQGVLRPQLRGTCPGDPPHGTTDGVGGVDAASWVERDVVGKRHGLRARQAHRAPVTRDAVYATPRGIGPPGLEIQRRGGGVDVTAGVDGEAGRAGSVVEGGHGRLVAARVDL